MDKMKKAKKWVDEYFDWLKASTTVKIFGEWIEESTPFLDCKNDSIQIYIKMSDSGEITLSDDGYTLSELDFFNGNNKKQRLEALNMYLKMYGVIVHDNELIVKANVENIYQRKHFFLQCILAINDLMMPHQIKTNSKGEYTKEVRNFFDERNISYVSGASLQGKSGISHSIDFIIPKRKGCLEKIVTTLHKPDMQNAKVSTFNLIDIREGRDEQCEQIVLLNDAAKEIKPATIEIFKNYDILPIKWSQRNEPSVLAQIA